MGTKRWLFNRNKKRDGLEKRGVKEQDLPAPKKISFVKISVDYFSRTVNRFNCLFTINGGDTELLFSFAIPWLIDFSITLTYDHDVFKAKYPLIYKNDLFKEWGFIINSSIVDLNWGAAYGNSNQTGFNYHKYWSEIIKGETTGITWGICYEVLKTERRLATSYKLSSYSDDIDILLPLPSDNCKRPHKYGIIQVPITVYKVIGFCHYKRWWKKEICRYDVASGVGIIVPGKGENSWDQDDGIRQSFFHPEKNCADFSCGDAKTPDEAADAYMKSITDDINRYY